MGDWTLLGDFDIVWDKGRALPSMGVCHDESLYLESEFTNSFNFTHQNTHPVLPCDLSVSREKQQYTGTTNPFLLVRISQGIFIYGINHTLFIQYLPEDD